MDVDAINVRERSADELFKEFKEVSITEFFRKIRRIWDTPERSGHSQP